MRRHARADLYQPPQTVVVLVPNMGYVGKHRGAAAAKPFCARNAAVTERQESLAVSPTKFLLCITNLHPAAQTVGLTVPIRHAGPVAQYIVTEKLEVHFLLPEGSRETRPVRLAHHGDDPTSTANRLVSVDLLHFESLKRSRKYVFNTGVISWKNSRAHVASTPLANTSACCHSRRGWHRACNFVPKRAGKHTHWERRRECPTIGA